MPLAWLIVLTFAAPAAIAADDDAAPPSQPATAASLARIHGEAKIDRLRALANRITKLQTDVTTLEKRVRDHGRGGTRRMREQLDTAHQQLDDARDSFETLAAHVNVAHLKNPPKAQKRDVLEELRELTAPVLDAFRRMSARPRKMEALRASMLDLKDRAERASKAQIIVMQLAHDQEKGGALQRELERTGKELHDVAETLKFELHEREHDLETELSKQGSILDSATSVVGDFMATKGRNMVLSVLVWLLLALGLFYLRQKILPIDRLSSGRWVALQKPLSALYGLLTVLTASAGALLCLYLLGDMLLFTLAILALSFVVWSTRQTLPHVMKELRLVLNLGPVREGERLVWRGLPWRVSKLGLRTLLENPALQGGRVQLPAAMLFDEVSRPVAPRERWFPTDLHDWVLLSDGGWGRVALQTPERVVVALSGTTHRSYTVTDYLSLQPTNLSDGFIRHIKLAVDHRVQPEFSAFEADVQSALERVFGQELSGEDPSINQIRVLTAPPTPWALQMEVQLHCSGALAPRFRSLEAAVVDRYVALCNDRNLPIPKALVAAAEVRAQPQ